MKTILVTGASGQLGQCFKKKAGEYSSFNFLFCSSKELDVTSEVSLKDFFSKNHIDICINCAAYTNVEQAENEHEKAFLVNARAVKILAEICKKNDAVLFHFSTDYVFDGTSEEPYKESDEVAPINVYGASKLQGENNILNTLERYFIFRTSWLYSEFGHNFLNTILKKTEEGAELNITVSQLGTPTNANDLAEYVLKIINADYHNYGIYHFSNKGEATWYDFAKAILKYSEKGEKVILNKTGFYKTLAKRPVYSVLSKQKANKIFGFPIPEWKTSLQALIAEN